jgi:hypothetical protein
MRKPMVAMALTLMLTAGHLQARPPRSAPADVGAGRIAWFDITTSNLPRSKEFYGKLFAWEFSPVEGTELAAEIVVRGMLPRHLRDR